MKVKLGRCLVYFAGFFMFLEQVQGFCPRDIAAAEAEDPTRVCRKPCSTDADCDSERKRCICDGDCGYSCFNPDAQCPDIRGNLTNGVITLRNDDRTYKAIARHRCNNGYYMTGVAKRTCRSTKVWSHTPPNCTRGCDPPVKLGNGFVVTDQPGFSPGDTAKYQCKTGYDYNGGSLSVTCQDDYTWSGATFLCVKQNCGTPGDFRNGKIISTSFDFGSRIKLECDPGYLLNGHDEMRCNAGPKWLPKSLPTCEALSCPAPDRPENGEVDEKYANGRKFGGEVDYSCLNGFKLDGPSRGRCNENATWGDVPKCLYDGDCDFKAIVPKTCGYNIVSGTFDTRLVDNGVGALPSYILYGTGVHRSASVPLAEDSHGACFKFDYKASTPDSLFGEVAVGGSEFQTVWKAYPSSSWTKGEVAVRRPSGLAGELEAQWQLRATSSVEVDNIVMRPLSECAPPPTTTTAVQTTVARTTVTTGAGTTPQTVRATTPMSAAASTTVGGRPSTLPTEPSEEEEVTTGPTTEPDIRRGTGVPDDRRQSVPGTAATKPPRLTTTEVVTGKPPKRAPYITIVAVVIAAVICLLIAALILLLWFRHKNRVKNTEPVNADVATEEESGEKLMNATNV